MSHPLTSYWRQRPLSASGLLAFIICLSLACPLLSLSLQEQFSWILDHLDQGSSLLLKLLLLLAGTLLLQTLKDIFLALFSLQWRFSTLLHESKAAFASDSTVMAQTLCDDLQTFTSLAPSLSSRFLEKAMLLCLWSQVFFHKIHCIPLEKRLLLAGYIMLLLCCWHYVKARHQAALHDYEDKLAFLRAELQIPQHSLNASALCHQAAERVLSTQLPMMFLKYLAQYSPMALGAVLFLPSVHLQILSVGEYVMMNTSILYMVDALLFILIRQEEINSCYVAYQRVNRLLSRSPSQQTSNDTNTQHCYT